MLKRFVVFLSFVTLALIFTFGLTTGIYAQASAPFISVAAIVPPAIGQPGVSLSWDTTNKLLVITFTTANAANVSSTLFTSSYNPHTLEGISGGGVTISAGGTAILCQHNLPSDPLKYQITQGNTLIACGSATGQTACPTVPF